MDELATIRKIEQARIALREVKDLEEIKTIVDQTEALKAYVKSSKASTEIQSDAIELNMIAVRRLGELSAALDKAKGGQPYQKKSTSPHNGRVETKAEVLSKIGVNRQKANRAEKFAAIPEKEFQATIAAAKAAGERVTKSLFKTEETEKKISDNSKSEMRVSEFIKTGIKPKGWKDGIDDELLENYESAKERLSGSKDRNDKKAQSTINADKDPVIETTLNILKLMIKTRGKDYMIAVCKALKTELSKLISWAEKQ